MKNRFIILLCFVTVASPINAESFNGGTMSEFVLIGKMKAKTGCEALLEDVLKELSIGTHTEPGCIFYMLHRDAEDPSIFVLIEGWASKEALEVHFKSPHFLQQFPRISSLISGDPELTYLTPLGEGKKGNLFEPIPLNSKLDH